MKKYSENISTALCALSIFISFNVNASTQQGNPANPPIVQTETSTMPESINVCVGKNEGDNCVFNQDNQKITGKCKKNNEGKMNCTIPK